MLTIVSFNINGVRAHIHQLLRIIEEESPDIICLQETKTPNDMFPETNYPFVHKQGGGSAPGLCILSKREPDEATHISDRISFVRFNNTYVYNIYFVQGVNTKSPKYEEKRQFYEEVTYILSNHPKTDNLIVLGDFNVVLRETDIQVKDKKAWLRRGGPGFQPDERQWLDNLVSTIGLKDSYGEDHNLFTWNGYRSPESFLRIDFILVSSHLHATGSPLTSYRTMERPSDHNPVIARVEV